MCDKCKKLEKQLRETIRVLAVSKENNERLSNRLIKNGEAVYNRGQFNSLVDACIRNGLNLLEIDESIDPREL